MATAQIITCKCGNEHGDSVWNDMLDGLQEWFERGDLSRNTYFAELTRGWDGFEAHLTIAQVIEFFTEIEKGDRCYDCGKKERFYGSDTQRCESCAQKDAEQ